MNQIEIWFGIITRQSIRRGTFASVTVLIAKIRDYIDAWNADAKPFTWTATAGRDPRQSPPRPDQHQTARRQQREVTTPESRDTRALRPVFQPIVRLETGLVEGYEALVRGPDDSPLASADALLAEAYRTGRVIEFDWAARASACRAALDGQLSPDQLLFLNIEPIALDSACPSDLRSDIEQAFGHFQIVLEVTERSLGRDPRALLNGIDRQRPDVAGMALDDVGSGPLTVALLAVLLVDVIKLDRSIIQGWCSPASSKILDIAHEAAERTGATILAEGVESAAMLRHASAFGADLAQGYYLGEPQALPAPNTADCIVGGIRSEPIHDVRTPFDAMAGRPLNRRRPTCCGH